MLSWLTTSFSYISQPSLRQLKTVRNALQTWIPPQQPWFGQETKETKRGYGHNMLTLVLKIQTQIGIWPKELFSIWTSENITGLTTLRHKHKRKKLLVYEEGQVCQSKIIALWLSKAYEETDLNAKTMAETAARQKKCSNCIMNEHRTKKKTNINIHFHTQHQKSESYEYESMQMASLLRLQSYQKCSNLTNSC
jgi:hypothetical protein